MKRQVEVPPWKSPVQAGLLSGLSSSPVGASWPWGSVWTFMKA